MTVDVAFYQEQVYPTPPCWALVADVYARELEQPVTEFKTVTSSVRAIAAAFRLALLKRPNGFVQIADPQDLAVVLLGRTPRLGLHHCGVVVGASVMHATAADGVLLQDMASLRDTYRLIEFWARES